MLLGVSRITLFLFSLAQTQRGSTHLCAAQVLSKFRPKKLAMSQTRAEKAISHKRRCFLWNTSFNLPCFKDGWPGCRHSSLTKSKIIVPHTLKLHQVALKAAQWGDCKILGVTWALACSQGQYQQHGYSSWWILFLHVYLQWKNYSKTERM